MKQDIIKSRKELFIRALRGRMWVYDHIGQYDKKINDCVNKIHFCKNIGYENRSIIAEIMIDYGSLDIAEKIGAKDEKIAAQRVMAKALVLSENRFQEAIIYLTKSIALARKLKTEFELAKSLYELAKIYLSEREIENMKRETVERILRHPKEAEKILKKIGAELWLKKIRD